MSVVANVAINVDSRNAVSKLREVQGQAQQTERAFGGIAAAVGKLAIAFAGIQAIKFVFTQAAELQTQARSLQILAGSAEKAGKIIKELQDLGAVTPFTSTELIDAAKRLQAFGVEADKVVETTRRLADASGATGAELSGLVTAYGQVQAKGRLQGEELLQFQERGIGLQQELRKMYGMTGEEFQKALEKGQISAKAVEVALQRLTDVGGKYANGAIAQSDTLNGKLSTLQDSFQRLAQNIGTFFEPVFKFLIDGINTFLDRVNNGLRVSAQLKANEQAAVQTRQKFGAFRAINPFDQEAQRYEENLRKSLLKSGLSAGRGAAPSAPGAPAIPALLSSAAGGRTGRRKGKSDEERAAEKAAKDAARAAEQAAQVEKQIQERLRGLIREVELIDQIAGIKELQFQAEMEGNKELQIRLQGEERIIQIMQATAQALDGITDERLKQNILAKAESEIASSRQETLFEMQRIDNERTKSFNEIIAGLDLELALKTATTEQAREQLRLEAEIAKLKGQGFTPEQIDAIKGKKTELAKPKTDRERLKAEADAAKEELDKLTDPVNMITKSAAGIGDAFATSFKGVVDGTMTAQQALGSFFKSVADMFLDMAAQIIAAWLKMIVLNTVLKIFGGAASSGASAVPTDAGGWANSFNTSLPGLSGDIGRTPIGFAEGGFVTGPTSAVIGEGGESEYVIPASKMQSAMSRYSRGARGEGVIAGSGGGTESGGGAAVAGPMVVDVRYSVERINDVEYVTASAFQAGMRQAAQQGAAQGEQRTLRRLQQSPGTRKRVGM